ncbi:uncharacterized protein LOC134207047 [Armigeres subalbatus]|uniref:uncharacterized protein LOC134207047 n=1 Tax=Armigeres subalbatus TaxID=124917 RepID=UPI002ECFFACE
MPFRCCVEGCLAMYGRDKVSFHRFPAIRTESSAMRRRLWAEAVKVTGKQVDKLYVCGQHFETGSPASPGESYKPNWIPTLKLDPKSLTKYCTKDLNLEKDENVRKEVRRSSRNPSEINFSTKTKIIEDGIIYEEDELIVDESYLLNTESEIIESLSSFIMYEDTDIDYATMSKDELIVIEPEQTNASTHPTQIESRPNEASAASPSESSTSSFSSGSTFSSIIEHYENELKRKDDEISYLKTIIEKQNKILKTFKYDLKSFEGRDMQIV